MTRIGRYEVEAEAGRGAMGRVYLAVDTRLRRRVAVKVHSLPEGLSEEQSSEFRQRFLREAQAAAVLSHPGIVTIYDADEDLDRGLPFIAMEYVEGRSLREILDAEGRLETERALEIGCALAQALQAAHDAGIVHRDIKPANILVREKDGAVKIADFGVARLSASELTRSGTSLGSPAYMSPEQIRGRDADGRSDLFSLAAMLYETLCGTRPFDGEDLTALAYSIVHETPIPISKRADGLPRGLDPFFDTALAKDPAERFQSGTEFLHALQRAGLAQASDPFESTVVESRTDTPPPPRSAEPADWFADPAPGVFGDTEGLGFRVRHRRPLGVAVILSILVLGGWVLFGGEEDAFLKLDARSSMQAAQLRLLIDGDEVYSRALTAPEKKKNFVNKILETNFETFEAWIEVEPGKHEVAAHVLPEGGGSGYTDTVVVDLEPGETRRLRLTAGRAFGSALKLKLN